MVQRPPDPGPGAAGEQPHDLRSRYKQATRDAIGAAALRLALEQGPRGLKLVRVSEIASAAGISPRTYNNYFSSREEAICALHADQARRFGAAVRARPAREPFTTAVIAAAVEVFASPEPDRAGLGMIMSTPELQGEALKAFTLAEEPLAEAIAARAGHGQGDLASHTLAAAIAAAIRVAGRYWLSTTSAPPFAEVLGEALRYVLPIGNSDHPQQPVVHMTTNENPTAAAAGDLLLGGDLRVNRLGFGAMRLALGGQVRDPEAGAAIVRRAVELGVDHIDTAGFYGFGELHAHEMIRAALEPYGDDVVIATKVGPLLEGGIRPTGEATPEQLRGLVEDDLRRLGLDRLDLVYLRVGAAGDPVAARFAALEDLRSEGLIRHLGVSNVTSDQLAEARSVGPVAAVQNHFHVHQRADSALVEQCAKEGIAYVPFFPLGGGRDKIDPARLASVADRHGAPAEQVALAWLLAAAPVILPIPGTSSLDHLAENVAAAGLRLTEEDLAELAE